MIRRYGKELPSFPLQKEHEVNPANATQFGEFLQLFLKRTVNIAFYDEEVQHFFDILPDKFGRSCLT
jgi:hypothetical protein